jgi:hypothetical protein
VPQGALGRLRALSPGDFEGSAPNQRRLAIIFRSGGVVHSGRLSWRPLLSVLYRRIFCTAQDRFCAPVAPAASPRDSRCHCMPGILAPSDYRGAFADLSSASAFPHDGVCDPDQHSLGVTVQRSHDTDAREYRRAARSATRSSTSIAKRAFLIVKSWSAIRHRCFINWPLLLPGRFWLSLPTQLSHQFRRDLADLVPGIIAE